MNILVTGGASGLGEAITIKLASDPLNRVYFTYNNAAENALKLTGQYQNVHSLKCNFRSKDDLGKVKQKMSEMDIDVLINNAYTGEAISGYFHKTADEVFEKDFANNVLPTIALTQEAITLFRKKKQGKIITVLTSFLINTPPIGASVYVANKAYLASMVKSWAVENAKFNITSNAVSPSFMQTSFTKDTDERIIEQLIASHPLKKLLTVSEVADVISFMCNSTNHMNGENIVLNAGVNM